MGEGSCELGGRFRRCSNPVAETCQYCGRSFCSEHAHFVEGFEAVCARSPCVAKHKDLQEHHAYFAGVVQRNRSGLCGLDGCNERRALECSKCHGSYCASHVSDQTYPAEGSREPPRMASVCPHCWGRRKIWSKR